MAIRHIRVSTTPTDKYVYGKDYSNLDKLNEVLEKINNVNASLVSIESHSLTYEDSSDEIVFDIFYTSSKKPSIKPESVIDPIKLKKKS